MKIKNELIAGFIVVILLSSLTSYIIIRTTFRQNFDTLVKTNDIEIASSYAESLGDYYNNTGAWSEIVSFLSEQRIQAEDYPVGDTDRSVDRKHPKDSDPDLVLTDENGRVLYSGIRSEEYVVGRDLPDITGLDGGEAVIVNDTTVGYVFYKSMIVRSYNPQEEEFIVSITRLTGLSVLVGIVFALIAGTLIAGRFAKPVTALDSAVQTITDGDMAVRVDDDRHDEIGSLAENFNLMADKLQGAERARQTLLADIAHELRTPVSVIQANIEMILDGVYTADEARLKSLYEETKILTSLISDLRSLSDLDSDVNGLRLEKINLNSFARETCEALRPIFREKKVKIEFIESSEDIYISAETDKLRQVFRNIFGNALKYAPEESVVTAALELFDAEGPVNKYAGLVISDEGPGVPEGDIDKIFDRFYRVDYSRNRESGGRGLGLAITKKIIAAFNGKISAFNNKPHGLSVRIELPVLK